MANALKKPVEPESVERPRGERVPLSAEERQRKIDLAVKRFLVEDRDLIVELAKR